MTDEPVEEEDEEEDEERREATQSTSAGSSSRNRRVLWGDAARQKEEHELHHHQSQRNSNHGGEEQLTEPEEEEDAVPQSFLIEAVPRKAAAHVGSSSQSRREERRTARSMKKSSRHPSSSRAAPIPQKLSKPPRPSELDGPAVLNAGPSDTGTAFASTRPQRGLDDYQKALWNWVNVYNLDAYLQEVRRFLFSALYVERILKICHSQGVRLLCRQRHLLHRVIAWLKLTVSDLLFLRTAS